MKIILKYISLLLIFILCLTPGDIMADKDPDVERGFSSGKKQTTFSKSKSFSRESKFIKHRKFSNPDYEPTDSGLKNGPPGPGDGGDGWPVPISGGLGLLILGSLIYVTRKLQDFDKGK